MSTTSLTVEKRDGSFQTQLSISPTQDIHSNRQLFIHEPTSPPISAGSSAITGQQQQQQHRHHHHHHRKHKSRNHSSGNISTRDVGLQVNIQTVKKITFTSQKSDESSAALSSTTSPSSPPTLQTPRQMRNVETNTEPLVTKRDIGTSCESTLNVIASSSQTTDTSSPNTSFTTTTMNRQTKAAQTPNKTLRDQAIETNDLGLFVCDLSSFLKNGTDQVSSLKTQRKS